VGNTKQGGIEKVYRSNRLFAEGIVLRPIRVDHPVQFGFGALDDSVVLFGVPFFFLGDQLEDGFRLVVHVPGDGIEQVERLRE
jgi:hypothetical protein